MLYPAKGGAAFSCTISDALAEQARGAEHQHQDQHEKREHVLVVRAEQDEVPAIALLAHEVGDPAVGAQVRQVADVAGAECFDQAEQNAAEHRSEEHTSELQSPCNLVCRLLLEKKK